jgi:hypothetical protein
MRMKAWRLGLLFCFVALLASSKQMEAGTGVDADSSKVSLCDVLAQPSKYAGKTITLTVRITSTKEGTSLWSPDCSKLGVRLHVDREVRSEGGIAALYVEMDKYGLSDRPIIATLTGVYVSDYFDEIRHRNYPVFKAVSAKDITRSPKAEHR